jgi:GNAT superfamily N-acetyltransferase
VQPDTAETAEARRENCAGTERLAPGKIAAVTRYPEGRLACLPDLPDLSMRPARFEDVPEALRLIRGAVERGCRHHYGTRQRDAVHASYAATLFLDVFSPFETVAAEREGRLVAVAQLDPGDARLRALFVEAKEQHRGIGRALLAHMEGRARARGCVRLQGAMSLNAVPFYARAGFRTCSGPERLVGRGVWIPVVRMEKDLAAALSVAEGRG